MRQLVVIIIFILLIPITFAINDPALAIQRSANFYSDYTDFFNTPPNNVIYKNLPYDNSEAYQLFLAYVSGEDIDEIHSISNPSKTFSTNKDCTVFTSDIILASKKIQQYVDKNNKFPLAIKINDCYISNSDFLYLLATMIRSEFENGNYQDSYLVQKKYFESTIKWVSNVKKRYVQFTMDYESDRPIFSERYTYDKEIVTKNVSSIGVNPKMVERRCVGKYCTIPKDYDQTNYTSSEVAWYTAVKEEGNIIFPDCYPYCGVLNGTSIILDDFVYRYGFPMVWHMTGGSIVAIATKPELQNKIINFKTEGLLELGIHTMYHTNIGDVSRDFIDESINNNVQVFIKLLNDKPTQFRAPYLSLPQKDFYLEPLKKNDIHFDNEADKYNLCPSNNCNYMGIPEYDLYFVSIDWKNEPDDVLLNIYLSHPWEVLYEAEGKPTYLKKSDEAAKKVFKKWMHLVGEDGLVPSSVKNYMENQLK